MSLIGPSTTQQIQFPNPIGPAPPGAQGPAPAPPGAQDQQFDYLEIAKQVNKGSRKGDELMQEFRSSVREMSDKDVNTTYNELDKLIDTLGKLDGSDKRAFYLDEVVRMQTFVRAERSTRAYDPKVNLQTQQGTAKTALKLF